MVQQIKSEVLDNRRVGGISRSFPHCPGDS